MRGEFDRFAFSAGLEAWMSAVFACNAYIDAAAPWALRKTDPERMAAVLGTLVVAVRDAGRGGAPVIPASRRKADRADRQRQGWARRSLSRTPIFPRLELGEEEEAA